MKTEAMSAAHQDATWEWSIDQASATTLPAAPTLRWLQVNSGRVWLTGGPPGSQAQDIWLQAGDRHALPPGTPWVLEGGPRASLSLLQPRPRRAPSLAARARALWNATAPRRRAANPGWGVEP